MHGQPRSFDRISDKALILLSFLVLLACLYYAFANAFLIPISGIVLNNRWEVLSIDECDPGFSWCQNNQGTLQAGDQVIAIGPLTYGDYRQDRRLIPFNGEEPGDFVSITFLRDGIENNVPWQMPVLSSTKPFPWFPILIVLVFTLPFWLAGTAALLFLRPRGTGWLLLILFTYTTAIWLAVGSFSTTRIGLSALAFRAFTWLMLPVYLHLHLTVPTPLFKRVSRVTLIVLYPVAILFFFLEFFQKGPGLLYIAGFLVAIGGSVILLITQWFSNKNNPSARITVRLMGMGIGLAFGPGLILQVIPWILFHSQLNLWVSFITLIAVPIWPFFYAYAISRYQLGALQFRANRFLSAYSFILVYTTAFGLVISFIQRFQMDPDNLLFFGFVLALFFVSTAPGLQKRYRRIIDRLIYGTRHDPDEIIRLYAEKIPAVSNRATLASLLADEIAPSLFVRQSAICLLEEENDSIPLLYSRGLAISDLPFNISQIRTLLEKAGNYIPPISEYEITPHQFNWIRLVIELKIQETPIGVWLFGARDPDDIYPPDDVNLIRTLANQTAIAIENVKLVEGLQKANEDLFSAYEATLEGWANALELRDRETQGHSRRVTQLTIDLGRIMGIDEESLIHLRRGALLHDIGKMGIPDSILLKKGPLTEEEWVVMRRHPEYAYSMMSPITYLGPALEIPYFHHERWDGSGYPLGLKGKEIPLAARIFAVIDVWDALRSKRPYREAWPNEEVLDYINNQAGKLFDPEVVHHFMNIYSHYEEPLTEPAKRR